MARNKFLKMEGLAPIAIDGGIFSYFYKDKEAIFNHLIAGKLAETIEMFKWNGLPKTLNPRTIELSLQRDGYVLIADISEDQIREHLPQSTDYKDISSEWDNMETKDVEFIKPAPGLYAFLGSSVGGVLDENYLPTLGILTNPYLLIRSLRKTIGKGCVWGWNDAMQEGLSPINGLWGGLLTEALVSLRCRLVLSRSPQALIASSEDEKAEAIKYLSDLEDGKLGVLANKSTLSNILGTENSGLRTNPLGSDKNQSVKEILETIQYLNAQWNIHLGLNDNYNMKREALNSTETEANSDTLYPIIEGMLAYRKKLAEDLNRLYGTNISVELDGQWKRLVDTEKIRMDYLEKSAEEIDEKPAPDKDEPKPEPEPEPEKKEEEKENA